MAKAFTTGCTTGTRLLDDLADLVDATRKRMADGEPLVLLGHSLGGLVAARFVSLHLRPVDALVLSSPALDTGLSGFQKLLLATLPRLAPNLRVGNGLDVQALSHDPAVVAAYQADPLCHDRISARLGRFIADAGPATLARAAHWSPISARRITASPISKPTASMTMKSLTCSGSWSATH